MNSPHCEFAVNDRGEVLLALPARAAAPRAPSFRLGAEGLVLEFGPDDAACLPCPAPELRQALASRRELVVAEIGPRGLVREYLATRRGRH